MGRISWCAQLRLLLHRNYLLCVREWRGTLSQVGLPVLVFLLLVSFRSTAKPIVTPEQRDKTSIDVEAFEVQLKHDGGVLLYAPRGNDSYVERVMDRLRSSVGQTATGGGSAQTIIGLDNEQQVEEYYTKYSSQSLSSAGGSLRHVWAAVLFPAVGSASPLLPCHLQYTLRLNGSSLPSTARSDEFHSFTAATLDTTASDDADVRAIISRSAGSVSTAQYLASGFISLQAKINQAILDVRAVEQTTPSSSSSLPSSSSSSLSSLFSSYILSFQSYPSPAAVFDPFHELMASIGPVYIILGYLPIMQKCVMQLVSEKEKRVKEQMKMAGLADSVFAVGFYFTYLAIALLPLTITTIMSVAYSVYTHTSFAVYFLLLFLYLQCLLLFSFLVSTFFSKSKLAGQFAATAIFLIFLPQYVLPTTEAWIGISNLSPPIAFARGFRAIADAESLGIELSLGNLSGAPSSETKVSVALAFLALDALVLAFAAWYAENVVQNDYGQAKPWNWLCTRQDDSEEESLSDDHESSAANSAAPGEVEMQQHSRYSRVPIVVSAPSSPSAPRVEEHHFRHLSPAAVRPHGLNETRPGIRIIDVHKTFDARPAWERALDSMRRMCCARRSPATKDKRITQALRGLSLTIARGEILSLLGPNASGKTTSLAILSGLLRASSGRVVFDGMGAPQLDTGERGQLVLSPTNLEAVREHLFSCPQDSIFFERLTVEENLAFYARLKGVPSAQVADHVRAKLEQLGLADKAREEVKNLSGGMKRKLCVITAFMGVSHSDDEQPERDCLDIIFLDEPSSGVDPVSRRAIWDMVQTYKRHRIIVLTTHSMSEAEALGDRIAIIQAGRLRCAGTSMFLKKTFGVGYKLEVIVAHDTRPETVHELTALVVDKINGAQRVFTPQQLRTQHGVVADEIDIDLDDSDLDQPTVSRVPDVNPDADRDPLELTYLLPLDAMPHFSSLFHELEREANQRRFHIEPNGISISLNSLEEIFFKVLEEGELADEDAAAAEDESNPSSIDDSEEQQRMVHVADSDAPPDAPSPDEPPPFRRVACALLSKKLSLASRDKKSLLFLVLFPVLYVAFGLIVSLKGVDTNLLRDSTLVDFTSGAAAGDQTAFDRLFAGVHTTVPTAPRVGSGELHWLQSILPTATPKTDFLSSSSPTTPDEAETPEMNALLTHLLAATDDAYSNAALYPRSSSAGSSSDVLAAGSRVHILYNNSATHAAPIMLNTFSSALFAATRGPTVWQVDSRGRAVNSTATADDACTARSINGANQPFASLGLSSLGNVQLSNAVLALLIVLSLSYVPLQFGVQVIKYEKSDTGSAGSSASAASNKRDNSAKASTNLSMQRFHGGARFIPRFWFINWLADLVVFALPIALIFILFGAFGNTLLLGSSSFASVLLLLVWAAAMIVHTYAWTYFFKSTDNMQLLLGLFYGTVTLVAFVSLAAYLLYNGLKDGLSFLDPTGNNGSGGRSKSDTAPSNPLADGDFDFLLVQHALRTSPLIVAIITICPSMGLPWTMLQLGLQNYLTSKRDAVCEVEASGGATDETGETRCVHTSMFEVLHFDRLGGVFLALLLSALIAFTIILFNERFVHKWFRQYFRPASTVHGARFSALQPQPGSEFEQGQLSPQDGEHAVAVAPSSPSVEPADVSAERARVLQSFDLNGAVHDDPPPDPLAILDLSKRFPLAEPLVLPPPPLSPVARSQLAANGIAERHALPTIIREKQALDRVSLGVRRGETFGLLGPNGAGKSTAMSVLIGALRPDSGNAFFDGTSCVDPQSNPAFDRVSHALGFVPQSMGLYDQLTPMEHLYLYGRLKGLTDDAIRAHAARGFHELDMVDHAHAVTENLSGGTKRKVSLLISLLGAPRILLLDEPSSGVDVSSRRAMWRLLSDASASARATVLTTHSMEEAETLSTRLGILINGAFRCIGTARQLKARHGGGLELQVKLAPPTRSARTTRAGERSPQDEDGAGLDTHSPEFLVVFTAFIRALVARARESDASIDTQNDADFDPTQLPPLTGFPFDHMPTSLHVARAPEEADRNSAAPVRLLTCYNGLVTFALPTPQQRAETHPNERQSEASVSSSSTASDARTAPDAVASPSRASTFSLSLFFAYMHRYATSYGVVDFTLNASTLDQLFVKLAREQRDEEA